jgi:hypothetical protein
MHVHRRGSIVTVSISRSPVGEQPKHHHKMLALHHWFVSSHDQNMPACVEMLDCMLMCTSQWCATRSNSEHMQTAQVTLNPESLSCLKSKREHFSGCMHLAQVVGFQLCTQLHNLPSHV